MEITTESLAQKKQQAPLPPLPSKILADIGKLYSKQYDKIASDAKELNFTEEQVSSKVHKELKRIMEKTKEAVGPAVFKAVTRDQAEEEAAAQAKVGK